MTIQGDKRLASVLLISLTCVLALTLFYAWCGYQLPNYTGPDERASADTTRFYLEHKRLAVLPDDTDIVPWTGYGGTRVARQPFNYLFAAIVAEINPRFEEIKSFRFASAMNIALAMGIIFLACYLLTKQLTLSLVATATLAFLPQVIYLASYHNDDAGAILGGAFALLCFVLGHRFRLNRSLLLAFSFTLGFIFINKPTVYAAIPALGLYLLYLIASQRYRLSALDILLCSAVFLGAGGWWLLNNIIVYGLDDPFQRKIMLESIALHAKVINSNQNGTFHKYGIGLWGFITNIEYWDATLHNAIANFGQLELSTFKFVYVFFQVPLLGGLLSLLYAGVISVRNRDWHLAVLLSALVFWLCLSYLFYAYFVAYVDVQFQGKYVIAAGGVFVLMLAYGLTAIHQRLTEVWQLHFKYIVFTVFALGSIFVSGICMLTTLKSYYSPGELFINNARTIKVAPNNIKNENVRNMELERSDAGLVITATSTDPMLFLDADICQRIKRNAAVEIDFTAEKKGMLRVFYDIGNGFKFRNSKHQRYPKGRQRIRLDMDFNGKSCRYIRIDPLETPDRLTLHEIQVTPYKFRVKSN